MKAPPYLTEWKQQRLRNDCAWACFCMLMSSWGVDVEPEEIIAKSPLPFLIEYDEGEDCLRAGLLVQRTEVFNAISYRYELDYLEKQTIHWTTFQNFANRLLVTGIPFMTGISTGALPAPIYKKIEKSKSSPQRHAVVITQFDDQYYHGLDPDGGLNRAKRHEFNEIEHLVSFMLDSSELKNGLEKRRNNRFLMGYLQPSATHKSPDTEALIKTSYAAAMVFLDKANRMIEHLTDQATYDEFSRFVGAYIKPIAMDLRFAIEIRNKKLGKKTQLSPVLMQLQDVTISIQKRLKGGKKPEPSKLGRLKKVILNTDKFLHQHIGSFSF